MFRSLTRGAMALAFVATFSVFAAVFLGPVHAADAAPAPAAVTVPLGDWIATALEWASSVVLAVAGWVVARWVPVWARQYLTDRLLANAVDYALGAVAGAARGKVLTVPVANRVLAEAMSYAVANAPALANWLGDTLRPKILARLGAAGAIPEAASSATLTGAP